MLTFIVSRGVPTEKYLTNGVFEFDQARALVQEGCEVVFLALDLRSIRRTRRWGLHTFTKQGVRVVELSVPLGNIPKAMFYPLGKLALRRLYHKAVKLYGRPDLLHAHFTDYAYLASLLADEEKLPLVVTEHSSLVNRQLLPADIEKPAKAAYRRADCLIAVSPALAVRMQQHSGRKVEWVPDMVDTNLFAYSDSRERQRAWMEETQTEEEGCSFTFLS